MIFFGCLLSLIKENQISKTSSTPLLWTAFFSGFTSSKVLASCESLGFKSNLFISSSSEADLIITPLFFVGDPEEPMGFISIAIDGEVPLYAGILSKNTPGMLVAFLSQSFPSFRNCTSLLSTDDDMYCIITILTNQPFIYKTSNYDKLLLLLSTFHHRTYITLRYVTVNHSFHACPAVKIRRK